MNQVISCLKIKQGNLTWFRLVAMNQILFRSLSFREMVTAGKSIKRLAHNGYVYFPLNKSFLIALCLWSTSGSEKMSDQLSTSLKWKQGNLTLSRMEDVSQIWIRLLPFREMITTRNSHIIFYHGGDNYKYMEYSMHFVYIMQLDNGWTNFNLFEKDSRKHNTIETEGSQPNPSQVVSFPANGDSQKQYYMIGSYWW